MTKVSMTNGLVYNVMTPQKILEKQSRVFSQLVIRTENYTQECGVSNAYCALYKGDSQPLFVLSYV